MEIISGIMFIAGIVLAVVFANNVKEKIRDKEQFPGMGWGIANGIVGTGILWVIIAHNSINNEITKIKNAEYKEYAKFQMKDFTKAYAICIGIWIAIIIISVLIQIGPGAQTNHYTLYHY